MNCSNPMCIHGQSESCCNPIHKYENTKEYRMRPYIVGEDLTHVSVSGRDTPEIGGMIAVGADDGALWYVSKQFFQANYEKV